MWRCVKRSIPTKERLQNMGMQVKNNTCVFCNSQAKIDGCLFQECPAIQNMWNTFQIISPHSNN